MTESAFELTTRKTIERDIVDALNSHDSDQLNAKLDIYPTGHERPPITNEQLIEGLHNPAVGRFFGVIQGIGEVSTK